MDRATQKRIERAAADWPWFGPARLQGVLRHRGVKVSQGEIAKVTRPQVTERSERATVIRLAVLYEIEPDNIAEAARLQYRVHVSHAFIHQVLREHRLLTRRQRAARHRELLV